MATARNKADGRKFDFERQGVGSLLAGRVIVDFDPGPDLDIGIFTTEEFEATFDVIEE